MEKDISINRIKELREDRDLRQIDVSNAVGIDQRTLSNYETGKTNPDSYAIIKLAQYFGVTCDYLLGVSERSLNDKSAVIDEIEDIRKRLLEIEKHIK
ncbi:MAG: helix-turn-helix domain-containing protein [Clostridia bacterium]|nr:helix-turn-helix domain-containing protein [Clostridia bacterium]